MFISNNASRMMGVSIIYWLIFLFPRFSHFNKYFVFGNGTAGHNSLSFEMIIFLKNIKLHFEIIFWIFILIQWTIQTTAYIYICYIWWFISISEFEEANYNRPSKLIQIDSNWSIDINRNLFCHKNTPFFQ